MRSFAALLVVLVVGCSSSSSTTGGGSGGAGGGGGSGGSGGGMVLPPADAGLPTFTADTFCEVFARTACQWAITCGQRTPAEEANCLAVKKHECPRNLGFDATAANLCLLRLESARCSKSRPDRCDEAWPAKTANGSACLATRECAMGVCASDGGSCGVCSVPGVEGDSCDGFHPCGASSRCAKGADAGVQCIGRLDAGEKCDGDDDACNTGRCLFTVGKGTICATISPGAPCTSNVGCASTLYCDVIHGNCRVPETLGADCDLQEACAAYGNVCLRGKCAKVAAFSVAEGGPCTESAQCTWGLACDVRLAKPVCTRRIPFDSICSLNGLEVWDPRCPYLAMCHPATQKCVDASSLCTFPGYCPKGPGPNERCDAGAICRGQSQCGDEGDGGFRCLLVDQPAGQACAPQLLSAACKDSSCVASVCAPWPVVPACGP